MTLIITLTEKQITIIWIAYLITWVILFLYARRWSKKKIKQVEHAHQTEQETLLDVNAVNWEELGFELGERPFIKLR